jgi:hypothetical protein
MTGNETLRSPARITAAQMRIAQELGPTSFIANIICEIYKIPEDVNGLTVVDLAAGTSSFVPWLLDNGADAYAVDCIYDQPLQEMLGRTKSYQDNTLDRMRGTWKKFLEDEREESMTHFSQSFQARRERFITAWLSGLPIGDNFADITVSTQASTKPTIIIFKSKHDFQKRPRL